MIHIYDEKSHLYEILINWDETTFGEHRTHS